MKLFLQPKAIRIDEENPYWISFSDLMSALLVIFILAVVALIIQLTESQEKLKRKINEDEIADRARKELLEKIRDELRLEGIIVSISQNNDVLTIPDSTLTFASGKFEIQDRHRKSVEKFGTILHRILKLELVKSRADSVGSVYKYLDTIFIEGHTDAVPVGSNNECLNNNWELSTFRAIALWRFWTDSSDPTERLSIPFDKMTNKYGQRLFSVCGYADSRGVELSPEEREALGSNKVKELNRRIEIRFTIMRPKITSLDEKDTK